METDKIIGIIIAVIFICVISFILICVLGFHNIIRVHPEKNESNKGKIIHI